MLRSVGSREGEHERATELLHTGFAPLPSFPRPSLGSMVSHERPEPGFPRYVTLGGNGFGPAFLGSDHGPFVISDIESAKQQLTRIKQNRKSLEALGRLNDRYLAETPSAAAHRRSATVDSVRQLLGSSMDQTLDLSRASERDRQRYGDDPFGKRVLTARRLLEMGVSVVEAHLVGWDTHVDNQRRTDQLCATLQRPWIALMEDLKQSGFWDDTLVLWMGRVRANTAGE